MIVAIYEFMPSDGYCSCVHLVIPDDMNLEEQKEQYAKERENMRSIVQWLIKNGARYTTDDEVIEIEEPS